MGRELRRDEMENGWKTPMARDVASLRELTDPQGKKVVFSSRWSRQSHWRGGGRQEQQSADNENRSAGRGEGLTTLLDDKLPVSASFIPWKNLHHPLRHRRPINATSIGLFPDLEARLDLDLDSLSPDTVVAGVIPNPPDTNLVRDAGQGVPLSIAWECLSTKEL